MCSVLDVLSKGTEMSENHPISPLCDPTFLSANQLDQIPLLQRAHIKLPSLIWPLIGVCSLSLMVMLLVSLSLTEASIAVDSEFPPLFVGFAALLPCLFGWLFFAGLLGCSLQLRTSIRVRGDLSHGQLAFAEGKVAFTGRGYRSEIAGRRMLNIDGEQEVRLPPGTYRFWLLPRSRRILSAELQWSSAPGGKYASLLAALAQANQFGLDDLAVNGTGRLSERQLAPLYGRKKARGALQADLQEGTAEMLEGYVQWEREPDGDTDIYFYALPGATVSMTEKGERVADVGRRLQETYAQLNDPQRLQTSIARRLRARFRVSYEATLALVPGVRYRVYFLPRTHLLLSIEPLP